MSSIDAVRDLDCIKSFAPLVFDMSAREVSGPPAVLRRVLYRWCLRRRSLRYAPNVGPARPLTELEGATFSRDDIEGYRMSLMREAQQEDFVQSARVTFVLSNGGIASVRGAITLVDGKTYLLEVDVSGAAAALVAIGGAA